MADRPPEESLQELDSRLQRLRDSNGRVSGAEKGPTAGYGLAFQLAADLVTGLVGGAAIGWALDSWLGTRPWGLIGFFFLGAAAGMWNVYKTVRVHERAALARHDDSENQGVGRSQSSAPVVRKEEKGGETSG